MAKKEKAKCAICGKEIGWTKMTLENGVVCMTCYGKIPKELNAPKCTIEEAKESIEHPEEFLATRAKEKENPKYVVLQVVLKEKFTGTESKNLSELEDVINRQAAKGYRLHTISTTSGGSKGVMGGDRIQATMVFERI